MFIGFPFEVLPARAGKIEQGFWTNLTKGAPFQPKLAEPHARPVQPVCKFRFAGGVGI